MHSALESNGHPSKLIRYIHPDKTRPSTVLSPENFLKHFKRWLRCPNHRSHSTLFHTLKANRASDPCPQNTWFHSSNLTNNSSRRAAPKFRPSLESQTNVVYKIPCADCSWRHIGETSRAFNVRKKEYLGNVKAAAKGSKIANYVWSNASVIDKGAFTTRKTLKAWHVKLKLAPNVNNDSCPLPGQYNTLLNKYS